MVTEFLAVIPAQLEKIKGWKYPAEPDKLDSQGQERMERRPSWVYLMKILEMIEKK